MAEPLTSFHISHLRGSTTPFTLPFKKGTKLTIVYGENGSGKTTICDAFDLLGNGTVGSLDHRSVPGKKESCWPSRGKSREDISVDLTIGGTTINASVGRSGVSVNPANHNLKVSLLRRATVQKLIEARAGERYDSIRHFIDVAGIEQAESNLRVALKNLEDELTSTSSEIATNTEELERDWQNIGTPGKDARSWATSISDDKKEQERLARARGKAKELERALTVLSSAHSSSTTAQAAIAPKQAELDKARTTLDEAKAEITDASTEVVAILRSAQAYFEGHPEPDTCPLCQSAENADGLAERTRQRIAGFTQLQRFETAKRDMEHKENALTKAQELAKDKADEYETAKTAWLNATQQESDLSDVSVPNAAAFDDWSQTVTSRIEGRLAEIDESASRIRLLDRAKATLINLTANEERYAKADSVKPRLTAMLELVSHQRREFTDSILRQIAGEVGRLYEEVHPGEGKDKVALKLDPNRRGSLNITAHFEGQDDTAPQAYFSDSHLDTLGLCIYLALAARTNSADTILVMDDVLGSVDEPHVDRLIHMLYGTVQYFRHCIVTTHYRPWKEKYRWGELKNGDSIHFIELDSWSLLDGIALTDSIPEISRLRTDLSSPSPDLLAICARSGVIMERLCLYLCKRYRCSLPYHPGEGHTIGEYLSGINRKKLRPRLLAQISDTNSENGYTDFHVGNALNEIEDIVQARNVFGCHYNEIASHLPPSDALRFGELVLATADALVCPKNGWPTSNKSGSYWATAGDTRRLHPLQKPS